MLPVIQALAGIALVSAMDALIKAAVATLPVLQVALMRYIVGSLIIVAVVAVRRPGWPTREALAANGLRAVLVVVTATSFFYALSRLPLAETLILSFVSPAFTVLFAALLLGERVGQNVLISLVAGFAGVLLIVAGGLGSHADGRAISLLGVAAVLVAAIGYAATNVLLRARAQKDPVLIIVAIQNLAPAAMLAGPGAYVWRTPEPSAWMLLSAIGAFGIAGHLLLAKAYAGAQATRLAAIDYTALVWAVLFGLAIFGEVPGGFAIAGAALILGSAWLAVRR